MTTKTTKTTKMTDADKAAIVTRIGACVIADTTNRSTMISDIKLLFPTDSAYTNKAAYSEMHGSIKAYRVMGELRLESIEKASEIIGRGFPKSDKSDLAKIVRTATTYASELMAEARYGGKKERAKRKARVSGANKGKAKGEGEGEGEDEAEGKGAFLVASVWKTPADCAAYALRLRDGVRAALTRNGRTNATKNAYGDALRAYQHAIDSIKA